MMYQTIGLKQMEKIEVFIDNDGSISILDSVLENLTIERNDAAHTFIDATKIYQSPSVTKQQLLDIYPILKKIQKEVRKL